MKSSPVSPQRRGQRSIELSVSPEHVWSALVAPGRHDWYYRLAPEGEFVQGGHVRWTDAGGRPAEESDVVTMSAPEQLELRTKYLFAPHLAALDPHRIQWHLSRSGNGCAVTLSWEAGDTVATMLEADAGNWLLGLRLAADPVAQDEIARLESIGEVVVKDLTPERLDDYLRFFDHEAFRDFPAWRDCYCFETHRTQSDEEWLARTGEDNRRDMIDLIKQGKVSGLLAYAEGKPVGWCNYGGTTALSGVMHRFHLEPIDHQGVGSVACFVIAAPYRGHGIASRLLDSAVERLRARGLKSVEAYPVRDEQSPQGNYRGVLSMYLRAGFETYRDLGRNVIVRKTL